MKTIIPIILTVLLAGCNTFRLPAAKERNIKFKVNILSNTVEWESKAVGTDETPPVETLPQP